ncbi:uncharacterized protein LOC121727189 isoform X2 [Aricia agestis]|uniref:uncharacterized protein LOC121727189 isoform X2 n=1 Tax=Aricia agestis TaxID=91739 RepID=UPI001C2062CE|nr:uncharacterized protein LOC121727189 isoform X2 [Aricia agestis]
MVARIWLCVFSVVILPYLTAKPVSLNKLIEAEESLPSENTPRISIPDIIGKPISLNKLLEERSKQLPRPRTILSKATQDKTAKQRTGPLAPGLTKLTKTGTIFSQNKNLSPLHYRKSFEIKSPIKPKRVTLFQRTSRLRNQSGKRETYQHGTINKQYIPLLRNLGVLFDNILGPDSGETNYEDYSESEERVCTCVSKKTGREPRQKAAASTRIGVTETTPPAQTPPTTTPPPTPDNVSPVGRHQNVSLLFTRNTTSVWRNHFGFDAGSGSPHLGSPEGHISGDSGDDERDTGDGETGTDPEDDEEDSHRPLGDHAGDDGPRRVNPGFVGTSIVSRKFKTSPNKTAEGLGGFVPEYEGEIQFEIRTDEAKGSRVLSEPDSGVRAPEEVQAEEKDNGDSSHQQFIVGDGEDTQEDQKLRGSYEGVSFNMSDLSDFNPNSDQNDKYVMIYDGYSVARDVNGKNTLTEKAITIHS